MAVQYANDWEDPRLSVKGFVIDYIVWRLARDGFEWRDAPDVIEGAEREHMFMRSQCVSSEREIGQDLTYFDFDLYCKLMFRMDMRPSGAMIYPRLVTMVANAGLLSLGRARVGNFDEIAVISRWTIHFIEVRIRALWRAQNLSWSDFMMRSAPEIARLSRLPRQYRIAQRISATKTSIHSKLLKSSVCILVAFVAYRIIRNH